MRYHSLDAVRGYAALTVLIAHTTSVGIYKNPSIWPYLEWSPLRFLWAGHQAVIVFFVLSGFALTKMIDSASPFSVIRYLSARASRLYIPFFFSLLLVFLSQHVLMQLGYSWEKGWMGIAKPDFNESQILNHLGMIGFYNYFEINPPAWSLVYEARISILFPLVYFLVRKLKFKSILLFLAIGLTCLYLLHINAGLYGVDTLSSSLLTAHYSLFFAIGSYVANETKKLQSYFSYLSRSKLWVAFAIALMLYSYPFNNSWTLAQRGLGDILTSIGAVVIILLSMNITKGRFFNIGIYLGKISFSLYLIHYTVLSECIILFYNTSSALVWAITIPASIIIAHLFTYAVDAPSIYISRKLYRKKPTIEVLKAK